MAEPVRVLYLDPFAGLSGDMFVGALLDAGLDLAQLHFQLSKLKLTGYRLASKQVMRGAMAATKFDVEIAGRIDSNYDASPADVQNPKAAQEHSHAHGGHDHSHAHGGHDHSHSHGHDHGSAPVAPGQEHRTYAQIRELINASDLSAHVKQDSLRCFHELAIAEGRVHNMKPDDVGFHEVGALDSIIDMVGVCAGLEALGVTEVWSGPVALGSGGYINCAHGLMPVPAPATLELMKGLPVREVGIKKEMTTPTGAALVKGLCKGFGPLPQLTVEKIGYGAGAREQQEIPNVLRVVLGTRAATVDAGNAETDSVLEVETNIDHTAPEMLGFLAEKLLAAGALDVFFTPIQMKKYRPGTKLTVLIEPKQLSAAVDILFGEGATLGLRYQALQRLKLPRRIVSVPTRFGAVNVKVGQWRGKDASIHPEYDDCRKLALQHKVALQEVIEAALAAFRKG